MNDNDLGRTEPEVSAHPGDARSRIPPGFRPLDEFLAEMKARLPWWVRLMWPLRRLRLKVRRWRRPDDFKSRPLPPEFLERIAEQHRRDVEAFERTGRLSDT